MSSDDEETEFWDELKCFRAPTGLSESDEEEAGDLQLTWLHELPPHSPQHQAALQLTMQLRQSLLLKYQQGLCELELKGAELDAAEAGQLLGLEGWLANKQGELSQQEAAALEALKESRARKLAALLSENKLQALQQKKAVEEALAQRACAEQKRQEEEVKRREEALCRQKEQEAGHKAAEQKREQEAQAAVHAAEAAAQHAQEKTQQQQKQQPAASPEQNQQQAGPSGAGPASGGTMAGTAAAAGRVEVTAASLLRISDSARAAEAQAWEVLSRARESVKPLVESKDPGVRKQRREIEQEVTVRLNQITSVQEQIDRKAKDLLKLLAQQQQQELRTYAYLVLAKRMMSQCEAQISQNPTSCFAYGATLSLVAAEHPDLAHLMVANVHQVCPLAVPKYYEERSGANALYLQQMKYKMLLPDPKHGKAAKELPESTDGYLSRMQGYLLFYAAFTVMQPPHGSHPHGIDHAWMYVARLLNSLPANRVVATALHIFLKAAGHRLAVKYGRQFTKLLGYIESGYLPDLAQGQDANVDAAGTRLQAYLNSKSHRQAPEGYDMPRFDRSAN